MTDTTHPDHPHDEVYEEVYRGRRIRIETDPDADPATETAFTVHIDGRPLHLMRMASGAHISSVCHYIPHRDPIRVARAAVDEMKVGGLAPHHSHPHA
ncbi:tyrosinase cofactor [Nocardia sp. CDC159]|uniref:Tyrosinase cofactor n=1 Tax=Nocardia pulmonis TaxID=2951408 RepID=A0A9X2E8Z2_9NOCA|nr:MULTISPECIES: tyrosinase cofactor [Nocardia]MCM6773896.1 tyrosinase cofactor [Nocardia pulmonis]MCM6786783.1 tyrosinase cofactor [Nocardia sp. CDC159]